MLAGLVTPGVWAQERIAKKGRLLLKEDFRRPAVYTKEFQDVAPGWRVRVWHGAWERTAAGIASRWETGHMPVLAYEGRFGDVVIEFEYRYEKEAGKKAVCRVSATNPELNPRAYSVSAWANQDSKERELGVVLEHDEWKPGVITTVGVKAAEFAPGRWHGMRLEVAGDRAAATVDGVTVSGGHEKFGLPKTLIAIGTGLSRHELRRLRVYEGLPATAGGK